MSRIGMAIATVAFAGTLTAAGVTTANARPAGHRGFWATGHGSQQRFTHRGFHHHHRHHHRLFR
jgi:hypothetical protein